MKRLLILFGTVACLLFPALAQDYGQDGGSGYSNDSNSAGQGIRSRRGGSSRSSGLGSSSNRSFNQDQGSDRFSGSRNSSSRYSNQRTDVDSNRYSRRREDTRNRNSNQPGTAGARASASGTPGTGKTLTTTKGKTPAPKKSTGGDSSARPATNVTFTMKADPDTNILYIESMTQPPSMNVLASQGEKFHTRVAYRNARNSKFQQVRVALKYDPVIMQPLGIDDAHNQPLLEEQADAAVDQRRGIISYQARFAQERSDEIMTIFKLEWKALTPTTHVPLVFLNSNENPTFVASGDGTNVLLERDEDHELEVSENSGLLDAAVAILPKGKTLEDMEHNDSGLTAIQLAGNISAGTAEGGMTMALQSGADSVSTGDEFLVDIVYDNPNQAEMDLFKVRLKFDPTVLQVVDHDEDNWISRDTNILDGPQHEELPFDYHIKNAAYNNTGEIVYEMGFSNRIRVPSRGVLATIKFKAIAPAAGTTVAFDVSENDRDQKTAVTFLGFNLIGTPGARAEAVRNAVISIN